MSQYTYFFAKKDDKPICIGEFSRSHLINEIFFAPYGHAEKIIENDMNYADKEVRDRMVEAIKYIKIDAPEEIKEISSFVGTSAEEKLDLIQEIKSCINENREVIKECLQVIGYIDTLKTIQEMGNTLYFGKECYNTVMGEIEDS